ncbi:L-rhamnose mutarotase-like [Sycon ciliatum]|uniref:L-rhamnose mutarotase-like n=1 Tax=Sycon ciliatum TaxID=27933 RepID=UPI0031F6A76B|eukprot:scpid75109/ scgid30358/ L-rhamnose mutarotase; Rhamnose 1-epimerase; Type-3 mutarotase
MAGASLRRFSPALLRCTGNSLFLRRAATGPSTGSRSASQYLFLRGNDRATVSATAAVGRSTTQCSVRCCCSGATPKHRRYAMAIKLRPEFEEEYIRYHAAVWPGVLQTIRDCNITNYSIFLRDGTLFGYFEHTGLDLKEDMAKMAKCPETQKWWDVMKPMQQPMDNLKDDEDWWAMLEEVFHTD